MLQALLTVAAAFGASWLVREIARRRGATWLPWAACAIGVAAGLGLAFTGRWATGLAVAALALAVFGSGLKPAERSRATDPKRMAAAALLGVRPDAGEDEVRAAYRRLMARAHPDQGGSEAEAAALTAARDLLLKR